MNVSLTRPLESFVETQIEKGFYSSQSEVLRAGLRLLQEKQDKLNIQLAKSLQQLENGEYSEINNEFWDKLKNKVSSKIEANKINK